MGGRQGPQLVHLIHNPVYVRQDTGHQSQACLLHLILAFVLHQMLLMHILLLLHPAPLIVQGDQILPVLERPGQIRHQQSDEYLFFLSKGCQRMEPQGTHRVLFSGRYQCVIDHLFRFSPIGTRFGIVAGHLYPKFAGTENGKQVLLHRPAHGFLDFLHPRCLGRDRRRNLPADLQHPLQLVYVLGIPGSPVTVQEDKNQ